jgi:hypothetical protein
MAAPEPKLHWYQFSLRSLLVFGILCAIPCSCVAVRMRTAERQGEATLAIENIGGRAEYAYLFTSRLCPAPPGPPWLRRLLGDDFFANVVWVDFEGTRVTDADLQHLKRLPQLSRLDLDGTQVTDADLVHLEGLTTLHYVRLDSTRVTRTGVLALRRALPTCEIIFMPPEAKSF